VCALNECRSLLQRSLQQFALLRPPSGNRIIFKGNQFMKKTLFFLVSLGLLSSNALAATFLDGSWKSNVGLTTYYAQDQTVKYHECNFDFASQSKMTGDSTVIAINTLSLECVSSDYWNFHQFLHPTQFLISGDGTVKLTTGETVGKMSSDHFSVAYEEEGQKFFIDVFATESGIRVEWFARSFDDVNFDMKTDFTH
jgi:hypothetical protein